MVPIVLLYFNAEGHMRTLGVRQKTLYGVENGINILNVTNSSLPGPLETGELQLPSPLETGES